MADPFIAEIKMFAGNFAPSGWAMCDGQLLAIAQNTALFSLVGTIYGGDGRTTLALPDMRGRSPMHWGSGPGLSSRTVGQRAGVEQVTLASGNIPGHSHTASVNVVPGEGSSHDPTGKYHAMTEEPVAPYGEAGAGINAMAPDAVTVSGPAGAATGHENMHPFLCVTFIIALVGLYPSRS